jgi:hypothetical protein
MAKPREEVDSMARTGAITYKAEILEQLRKKLRALPEHRPEGLSKTEIVRSLAADIDELQKRGYSMRAIAEIISSEGVPITTVTLKGYLGRLKPPSRRSKRRRRRDAAAESPNEEGRSQPEKLEDSRLTAGAVHQHIADVGPRGDAEDSEAVVTVHGNKKSTEPRPEAAGATNLATTEARRVAGADVDKRKSTFIPRDDSRDI